VKIPELPNKPWNKSSQEILEELGVSPSSGLDNLEVKRRRRGYGPNRLREAKRKSAWLILADQFRSLIVLLLGGAAALSFGFGDWIEGLAIIAVIFINATIGFFTELKAVRSMEALHRLGSVSAKVRREGQIQEIHAQELVPGDIVVLEGGDIVTADLRLIQASKLQADESTLTGESMPVSKMVEPLEEDVPLAERTNMLFKGTAVTRGSSEGIVVSSGMDTELGKISSLVEEAEEEVTPLEKQLNKLGHKLIWATLAIAAFVAVGGILAGKEMFLMIETSIALAVAAIPEGLPIVATIALARGMWRMAHRNALINRLSAVETLGATNVICTDKTGTLTENRLTVTRIALESGVIKISGETLDDEGEFIKNGKPVDPLKDKVLYESLKVGVLCNNSSLQRGTDGKLQAVGEPLEGALLVAGFKGGIDRNSLIEDMPEVREEAFDPDVKMMATFQKHEDRFYVAVKGAPESVLEKCTLILTQEGERRMNHQDRERWLEKNDQMAEEGLRMLALAKKTVDSIDSEPYQGLTFLGLVGLVDPPRTDVRQAIQLCQQAGVRVIMVTGDQVVTARNVGWATGLIQEHETEVVHGGDLKGPDELSEQEKKRILKTPIFARVSPKQKLDLIDIHQKAGSVVAMTGDGVNDAPALKEADIGIAMGLRGTQVAREAADMVLKDDAFPTIVAAIAQGRVIFNNIRKFVFYLISCNVSEILAVTLASIASAPLPILPLQILFLNLVTDVFPALALGVGGGDPEIMMGPARDPKEPILGQKRWLAIGGYGLVITFSVLGALALAILWLKMGEKQAVTVSFLTLAFAQLWHVFNMREPGSSFLHNDIIRNPFIWGALALCTGLLLAAVYIPGLAMVLKVMDPGRKGWLLVIVMGLIPWIIGQIVKSVRSKGA
jgi:Ca2+-transporting ATPase